MQNWVYLFVFSAFSSNDGEFRPRFVGDQELENWQTGSSMYEYTNQLGDDGWELPACQPIIFVQSSGQEILETQHITSELRAIEMVFK